jgi:PIN domain nuclease of toxin-antitoxin system
MARRKISASASPLLLDTHIWYWLLTGNVRLKRQDVDGIIEAHAREREVMVSAISAWEIAMRANQGRMEVKRPYGIWMRQAIARSDVMLVPVDEEIAVEAYELPGVFHGDPADRMIVATARVKGATLLTYDKQIIAYAAETKALRVVK